ncbi:MAG: VTT domain-containing protein [bacterium]|nr:VTT domain-containing protein [bacterium]
MNLLHYLDPSFLITTLGLVGVFAIVFAESGLFFGFFLPGDSLLFTAGLLASQGHFNIVLLWLGCMVCAVAGDSVGYAFGKRLGLKLLTKEDSFFFRKAHIHRTEAFYQKHGKKTLILARFIPIVRTFAPILAGVGKMEYRLFLSFNVIGGVLWSTSLIFLGFVLGNLIPSIDRYLLPIIALIIVISFIPVVLELLKSKKAKAGMGTTDERDGQSHV